MSEVQSGTRISWNQGRIFGPKPPLKPKHIWAIRTRLQHDGCVRDLAMFNTAIDSKLRGCDLATAAWRPPELPFLTAISSTPRTRTAAPSSRMPHCSSA